MEGKIFITGPELWSYQGKIFDHYKLDGVAFDRTKKLTNVISDNLNDLVRRNIQYIYLNNKNYETELSKEENARYFLPNLFVILILLISNSIWR